MKVGIYVRVSTIEQANEGYSVREQTERLKNYCLAKGWLLYKTYTDPGYSGSTINRPAMTELLSDIEKGTLDLVLVYKLDRLSRSQKDTLYLIEDVFLKNNVDFVSMSENFDTSTPFGRAMIGLLSVFSQLEREQIRERMAMGRQARAKDGFFHGGGYTPIGYDYVDGELVVNDYEAMQVRKVHDLFQQGYPISQIQKIMNDNYTTKYSSWADHSSVRSVLTQSIYAGKIEWHDNTYEGRHKAIISEETYKKTQKRYKERTWTKGSGEQKKRPFQAKYLLTGLLYCANCGARYYAKGNYSGTGENKTYRPYYTCYSRGKTAKRFVIDPTCKNKSYPVVNLDPIIKEEVKKLALNPKLVDEYSNKKRPPAKNDNAVIEKRLEEIKGQLTRLLDLYQLGTVPFDTITERVDQLNSEKQALTEQLVADETLMPELSIAEAKDVLRDTHAILKSGNLIEQRNLVHSLIHSIVLEGDDIKINWAFVI